MAPSDGWVRKKPLAGLRASTPYRSGFNLYLIGPMGAGKSTVGRLLASALDVPFLDLDQEIERRSGVDIPTIFEFEGEEGFRRREHEVLKEIATQSGAVVATGGGVVLWRANRSILKRSGFVIYLSCPVEIQLERTRYDTHRPLLQTEDREARLCSLMEAREPLYREVADLTVRTDVKSSRAVAQKIIESLTKLGILDHEDSPNWSR